MPLKISPLLIPMLVILTLTNNIKIYLVAYFVMALHEFAHLFVATIIGLKTESITFSPFGVNLKLRNRIVNTLSEEILLYLSGPLVNGILALCSIYLHNVVFYKLNISLFIMNLMPIIPLDGGMLSLRLLSYYFGKKTAKRILNVFSGILVLSVLTLAVYMMIKGQINISMFIISVFFIGNILTGKEKYNFDLIDTLSGKKKRTNKVKIRLIDNNFSDIDILNELSPSHTVVAIITDENGKIEKIMSESEFIEKYYSQNLTL